MPDQRLQKMFIHPQVVVQQHDNVILQLRQKPVIGKQKIVFRRDHRSHRRKLPLDPLHVGIRAAIVQNKNGTTAQKFLGGGDGCWQQMLQMLPAIVIQNRETDGFHCRSLVVTSFSISPTKIFCSRSGLNKVWFSFHASSESLARSELSPAILRQAAIASSGSCLSTTNAPPSRWMTRTGVQ